VSPPLVALLVGYSVLFGAERATKQLFLCMLELITIRSKESREAQLRRAAQQEMARQAGDHAAGRRVFPGLGVVGPRGSGSSPRARAPTRVGDSVMAIPERNDWVPTRVMDALMRYDWPGNVRELQNVIERALVLSPGSVLRLAEPLAARIRPTQDRLDENEREHILRILERCCWRINGEGNAAAVLGLKPSTLRTRMQKLGIRRPARPQARDR
jgi:hypothetical protein